MYANWTLGAKKSSWFLEKKFKKTKKRTDRKNSSSISMFCKKQRPWRPVIFFRSPCCSLLAKTRKKCNSAGEYESVCLKRLNSAFFKIFSIGGCSKAKGGPGVKKKKSKNVENSLWGATTKTHSLDWQLSPNYTFFRILAHSGI